MGKISDGTVNTNLTGNELVPISGAGKPVAKLSDIVNLSYKGGQAITGNVTLTPDAIGRLLIAAASEDVTMIVPKLSDVKIGQAFQVLVTAGYQHDLNVATQDSDVIIDLSQNIVTSIGAAQYLTISCTDFGTGKVWLVVPLSQRTSATIDIVDYMRAFPRRRKIEIDNTSINTSLVLFVYQGQTVIPTEDLTIDLTESLFQTFIENGVQENGKHLITFHNVNNKTITITSSDNYKTIGVNDTSSAQFISLSGSLGIETWRLSDATNYYTYADKVSDATGTDAAQINEIRDALIAAGIMGAS